jgi:Flp pilus assembly pilin Flp
MFRLVTILRGLRRDDKGGALAEYAIIFAVVASLTVAAISALGTSLQELFTAVSESLDGVTDLLDPPAGG